MFWWSFNLQRYFFCIGLIIFKISCHHPMATYYICFLIFHILSTLSSFSTRTFSTKKTTLKYSTVMKNVFQSLNTSQMFAHSIYSISKFRVLSSLNNYWYRGCSQGRRTIFTPISTLSEKWVKIYKKTDYVILMWTASFLAWTFVGEIFQQLNHEITKQWRVKIWNCSH